MDRIGRTLLYFGFLGFVQHAVLSSQLVQIDDAPSAQSHPSSSSSQNEVGYAGFRKILRCVTERSPPFSEIVWREYITNESGAQISLNYDILPSHPNAARYTIYSDSVTGFHLSISTVIPGDAGRYTCEESGSTVVDLSLVVLPQENVFTVTATNNYSPLYIDGVQVTPLGPNNGNWVEVDRYPLDKYARLIAMRGANVAGGCSGILGEVSNTALGYRIVTDNSWKCSLTAPPNWMALDFNDSGWPQAHQVGANGVVSGCSWIPIQDLPPDSFHIWTERFQGGDVLVSCRKYLPACDYSPCENGGTCQPNAPSLCLCPVRYTGRLCETDFDECESNPCRNGGECHLTEAGYSCHCQHGFTGYNCETDTTLCASQPCVNNATCTHDFESDDYICNCAPGYTDRNCETEIDECESEPCQNGGTCTDGINSVDCECAPGFTGFLCEIMIDYCGSDPCQHGSTCVPLVNSFRCDCHPGYNGTYCEIMPAECEAERCFNGATCTLGGPGGSVICLCREGWFGPTCAESEDSCESNPCRNGGTCLVGDNRYDCRCDPAYFGMRCEFVHPHCGSIMVESPYQPVRNFWSLCEINIIDHAQHVNTPCRDLLTGINYYNNSETILALGGTFGCFVTKFPEDIPNGACVNNYNIDSRLSACLSCTHMGVCIRVPVP